jgi:hypothetical protein
MSESTHHESTTGTPKMSGDELASRVFTVAMTGVCAAILLMVIIGIR